VPDRYGVEWSNLLRGAHSAPLDFPFLDAVENVADGAEEVILRAAVDLVTNLVEEIINHGDSDGVVVVFVVSSADDV
jgi:hypothetical protein